MWGEDTRARLGYLLGLGSRLCADGFFFFLRYSSSIASVVAAAAVAAVTVVAAAALGVSGDTAVAVAAEQVRVGRVPSVFLFSPCLLLFLLFLFVMKHVPHLHPSRAERQHHLGPAPAEDGPHLAGVHLRKKSSQYYL